MKYKTTPVTISIHAEGDSPIFGVSSTHVTLEDEGGGCFIKITQCHDETEHGSIRLEKDEIALVMETALSMLANVK